MPLRGQEREGGERDGHKRSQQEGAIAGQLRSPYNLTGVLSRAFSGRETWKSVRQGRQKKTVHARKGGTEEGAIAEQLLEE